MSSDATDAVEESVESEVEVESPSPLGRRRLLIVEDHALARTQLQELFQADKSLHVDVAAEGQDALRKLQTGSYSVLVTDLQLPGLSGMDLIRKVQELKIDTAVIVTTGHGSMADAIEAMRLGADDFLTKPIDIDHLQIVIDKILKQRKLRDEVVNLRQRLTDRYSFQNVISKNPRMLGIFELISNIADSNSTVLIEGETGTGKEQIARAIHQASLKRNGPMVAINCSAVPETLLESELFGHEKGAFTGAVNRRVGRFEAANGGTLFLDEVGDIPAAMQAKLLRVLQERQFERVGSMEPVDVDVRIVAATNKSLRNMVSKGDFREDLFYRLNVVRIELPPLRERMEDLPLLVAHFAGKYARPGETPKEFEPAAMERLMNYSWPGNIRELENAIEYSCVTGRGATVSPQNLPSQITSRPGEQTATQVDLSVPLMDLVARITQQTEKAYLLQAMAKANGNVGKCAKICGLSRRSISTKLSEYGIDKTPFK